MDDGHKIDVKAHNAADAMQSALTKHIGHRVAECYSGSESLKFGGRIEYEIPKHQPLTEVPAKRPVRVQEPESPDNAALRNKHAPWIEEWLKTTGAQL
jgi:hypothetical protein